MKSASARSADVVPDEVTRIGRPAGPAPAVARSSPPPEDLSDERLLANCARVTVDGVERPACGRFALLSCLGRGGMGVVYHAVHTKLGTEVAVKVLPQAVVAARSDLLARFEREARLAAQLRSEHLVSVLDIAEDPASGCHFIVMEFVRGLNAQAWRDRNPHAPEGDALDICIGATKGLAAAHAAGIVHRDVKPANLLIPCDEEGCLLLGRTKLADLGLARHMDVDAGLTGTAQSMGTLGYIAPEQAKDAKRVGRPADVFGMAATLYALLTGTAPFSGGGIADSLMRTATGRYRPLSEVRPDVSAATAHLVARCLVADAADRVQDASAQMEMLVAARAALGTTPIVVAPASGAVPTSIPVPVSRSIATFDDDVPARVDPDDETPAFVVRRPEPRPLRNSSVGRHAPEPLPWTLEPSRPADPLAQPWPTRAAEVPGAAFQWLRCWPTVPVLLIVQVISSQLAGGGFGTFLRLAAFAGSFAFAFLRQERRTWETAILAAIAAAAAAVLAAGLFVVGTKLL